jgi:hypothetical protein
MEEETAWKRSPLWGKHSHATSGEVDFDIKHFTNQKNAESGLSQRYIKPKS